MNFLEETISTVKRKALIEHLGAAADSSSSVDSLRKAVLLSFDGVSEAIQAQSHELNKLQRLGRIATALGLVLFLIGCALFLFGKVGLGAVSGLAGALVEVFPLLIFKQIEQARAAFRIFVPDSMHLFSMVVLLDYAERNPSIAESILGMVNTPQKKQVKP